VLLVNKCIPITVLASVSLTFVLRLSSFDVDVFVLAVLVCGHFGLSLWPFWSDLWPFSLWPFWFVAVLVLPCVPHLVVTRHRGTSQVKSSQVKFNNQLCGQSGRIAM